MLMAMLIAQQHKENHEYFATNIFIMFEIVGFHVLSNILEHNRCIHFYF